VRKEDEESAGDEDHRSRFNPEQHIMIEDARRIKRDAQLDEEISFPLEMRDDFGRIAAQAAKQVIMQKIREAERASIIAEYGEREGSIVTGHVQRFERGNLYIDLGRATAILPYDEQIPGERYRQGERVRALLLRVDEGVRGTFIRLSRSHPKFLTKLFEAEVPEMANGTVEVKGIVREPGSRAKIAVHSIEIDVVEWSDTPSDFVKEALKPAQVISIELIEDENRAIVQVAEDQQSLAIGRGGQNVRLAARLTGWKIDIRSMGGEQVAAVDPIAAAIKPAEETTDAHMEISPDGSIKSDDAFGQVKTDIAGDDDATTDIGEATSDPQSQNRDVVSEVENETTDKDSSEKPDEVEVDKE
jgi:N utilization substance protein A